jgi:uncharacterized protein with von Willebrand factor type A (vWA) domain
MKNGVAMSKSSSIQHLYREISIDPNILSTVFLGKAQYSINEEELMEEFKTLQDLLIEKLKYVIATQLTERQREVMIKIYFEQRTQMETADLLGVCQTTIHKIVSGNIDYSNKDGAKRYGGALKKIRKFCETDPEVIQILARMEEIRGELSAG